MEEGNLSDVFVIQNGLIRKTKVTVGSLYSNFSRIKNGIGVGDSVVTYPNNELQNGQEVLSK